MAGKKASFVSVLSKSTLDSVDCTSSLGPRRSVEWTKRTCWTGQVMPCVFARSPLKHDSRVLVEGTAVALDEPPERNKCAFESSDVLLFSIVQLPKKWQAAEPTLLMRLKNLFAKDPL